MNGQLKIHNLPSAGGRYRSVEAKQETWLLQHFSLLAPFVCVSSLSQTTSFLKWEKIYILAEVGRMWKVLLAVGVQATLCFLNV